jgi:hypothetical protein
MGYSRGAISAINRRFKVREYFGKTLWKVQINPDLNRSKTHCRMGPTATSEHRLSMLRKMKEV